MTDLTGKQKRHLRALGTTMRDAATLGHNGLSDATCAHIKALLARQELIKVRMIDEYGSDRKTAAQNIAAATDSTVAGVVGRTVLLYKANPELDAEKRVKLPGASAAPPDSES